jgi:hypothetical protein
MLPGGSFKADWIDGIEQDGGSCSQGLGWLFYVVVTTSKHAVMIMLTQCNCLHFCL